MSWSTLMRTGTIATLNRGVKHLLQKEDRAGRRRTRRPAAIGEAARVPKTPHASPEKVWWPWAEWGDPAIKQAKFADERPPVRRRHGPFVPADRPLSGA
jgi:hypothetical protein